MTTDKIHCGDDCNDPYYEDGAFAGIGKHCVCCPDCCECSGCASAWTPLSEQRAPVAALNPKENR